MRPAAPARDRDEQQLTSMIDVVFLLLIFFVCTLHFRVLEGRLDTRLPRDQGGLPQAVVDVLEPLDVALALDPREPSGFSVRVWGRRVPLDDLAAFVARVRRESPDTPARLSVAPDVAHGQVVSVIDAVMAGGIEELRFAAG